MIKSFERLGNRVFNIEELRNNLGLKPTELINFKDFNRRVLSISQREINGKTDMRLFYEPIKEGRKVTQVRFKVKFVKPRKLPKSEILCLLPGIPLQPLGDTSVSIVKDLRLISSVKRQSVPAKSSKPKRTTAKPAPTIVSPSVSPTTLASVPAHTEILLLKASVFQRAKHYLRSLFWK